MTAAAPVGRDILLPPMPGDRDALTAQAGARLVRFGGAAMGTEWSVTLATAEAATVPRAESAALRAIALVIRQMSQWEPDSTLSLYNAAQPGTTHRVPPQFAIVLDCALAVARATDGAFDPTLGAVAERWGFGAAPSPERQPHTDLAFSGGGWRGFAFDPATRLLPQPGGVGLDFSGIAKGFAVDLVSLALEREGFGHFLVEIGGELRARGVQPDGQPWWVAVEGAADAPCVAMLGLSGWSVATSGQWRRRRSAEGASWGHTIDPATGAPLAGTAATATVLHRGCMQADALATAMLVMPPDRAMAFADGHSLAVRLTEATGGVMESPAWQAMRGEEGEGG